MTAGHLNKHKKIHTEEKPYRFSKCDRQFSYTNHFNRHMKIHTGEKPCVCELYGTTFVTVCHLKTHMLIHTGEKPHVCEVCGSSFTRACRTYENAYWWETPLNESHAMEVIEDFLPAYQVYKNVWELTLEKKLTNAFNLTRSFSEPDLKCFPWRLTEAFKIWKQRMLQDFYQIR